MVGMTSVPVRTIGSRLVSSKFPPIDLFDDVADAEEFAVLFEIQRLIFLREEAAMNDDKDPNPVEEVRMSRLRLDQLVPAAVKGKIMAASKAAKPPVRFHEWAMNVLIATAETTMSDDGFVVVMRGGTPHLSGGDFLIPVGCSKEKAQEFVDYLNVATARATSSRLA